MMRSERKFPIKLTLLSVLFVGILITIFMSYGINTAGHRTVIQYPTGTINIKFKPGWYLTYFGSEEVYNDVTTLDFDKSTNASNATIDQPGIAVRYQDGGTGTIYGISRFSLPNDETSMLALHKAFRSNTGLAYKLLKTVTEESMNLTAGLMTSEEAYAEKRGIYAQWAKQQLDGGKFETKLTSFITTDEITNKRVVKKVPEIALDKNGKPIQYPSDLKVYGIDVSGFQITDWSFEKKTMDQISEKRKAQMAIITAKANAERAIQDAITAEEQGKANVVTAQYQEEVLKEKAVVVAQREKQVAEIAAAQKVSVAEQVKLEAEQKKFAAIEYKEEQILIGQGDAERKRLVIEADGALEQKLATYTQVSNMYANAIARQKWVPEVQMGSSGSAGTGSAANDLISMFMVKTAKDLSLDMKIKE